MTDKDPIVFIIDDDGSVRKSLERLLRSVELNVDTYSSAQAFLARDRYDGPCCLVLDVRMPGLSGLDLQQELRRIDYDIPIVFITGHGDIPMSVRAMKQGALDFLTKPFNDQDLIDAIQKALQGDVRAKREKSDRRLLEERADSLTAREREVFSLVVRGMLNKQIAYDLDTSEKTVKVHRARAMEKMKADSLADLVRMADKIGVYVPNPESD